MDVLKDRCVGCGNCIAWCPVGCIYIAPDGLANINLEECVECSNCFRMAPGEGLPPFAVKLVRKSLGLLHLQYDQPIGVCPTNALKPPELTPPRDIRRHFSDPPKVHPTTGYAGRGTEEIKTNDLTHRLKEGDIGFVVEVGRPGIGSRFRDVEKVAMALAEVGVEFERKNPVTYLMKDRTIASLRDDVKNEKILSVVIEFRVKIDKVRDVLRILDKVEHEVDTVFSVGISALCSPDGSAPYVEIIRELGWPVSAQAKVNLGLGRY